MKSFAAVISSILILGSCSSEPEVVHLRTEKKQEKVNASVTPSHTMTVEIKGMKCEMGCGGSIRKELKSTGGVARVEFDFVEDRKIQTARISYDSQKLSPEKVLDIVNTMNDEQFEAQQTNLELIENSEVKSSRNTENSQTKKVQISETSYSLPNLFDILANLL